MKRAQQGFTLIELMIVVAIIGILAAIAIPAYQDYTCRAKMSEAVTAVAPAKTAISEYFVTRGQLPADTYSGFEGNIGSKYVTSVKWASNNLTVAVDGGQIGCSIGTNVDAVVLSPMTSGSRVDWACKPASGFSEQYLPASCQT